MRSEIELLHLSYDPISVFEPRVPGQRLDGEDGETKRICLAPDIESAINAKVDRATAVQVALKRKIPLALYVYTAKIPRQDLVLPITLYRNHGVKDAILNQEYWVLSVPNFEEHILVVDDAVFDMYPDWPSPMVKHIVTHEVASLPAACIQTTVQKVNALKGTHYTTDFLLSTLEDIKKYYHNLKRNSVKENSNEAD